jgi:hypothetical protein
MSFAVIGLLLRARETSPIRISRIAQAVAEKVKTQHKDDDKDTRDEKPGVQRKG